MIPTKLCHETKPLNIIDWFPVQSFVIPISILDKGALIDCLLRNALTYGHLARFQKKKKRNKEIKRQTI